MGDDLLKLLPEILQPEVTDVFVTSGKVPSVRVRGGIRHLEDRPVISSEAVDALRGALLDARAAAEYAANGGYDLSLSVGGRRCRVNFLSTANGPAAVFRPVSSGGDLDFERLNLPGEALKKLAGLRRGIVFFAGGTGSGKTTTLNALVNYINTNSSRHILTLEDPIEYIHPDKASLVTQREIRGGGFAAAMRLAVRENPDVIVLGEIRDAESVTAALNAALTGHLVLSTVHCGGAVALLERILGFFPASARERVAADLALSLEAVVAQRLLPHLGGGAVPAVELLLGTPTVRKQLAMCSLEGVELALLDGGRNGMITLNAALCELYRNGAVSRRTALEASDTPEDLELRFRGISTGGGRHGDSTIQAVEHLDMSDLFHTAVRMKASDLVLTHNMPPILRINGVMQPLDIPPLATGDIRRLIFSVLDRQRRRLLEERRELDFSLTAPLRIGELGVRDYRFRLNAYFQRGVPALVARVLDGRIPDPEELRLPPVLLKLAMRKQGLILVTGPTGSGKSTTLASLLEFLNERSNGHIITIEDPIEFVYTNKNCVFEQRELHLDTESFADALRSALRQAPDVIMVGELRDPETIAAALTAAETGHLVLGTIHTNDAAQTVDRIIDSFPENAKHQIRQQFAACILAVVSQRLLVRADGSGRVAAFEIMVGTPPIRTLIREAKGHQIAGALETGFKDGMQTLARDLENLAEAGIIRADTAAL